MAIKKKVVDIDTKQAQLQVDQLKESMAGLNTETKTNENSIKGLRQQLKDLKNVMLSTEQGTEEYNKALTEAAEITHTLREQTEFINATAMDFGQIVGNVTGALGGFIGGFQAAKAVLNAFGIENEAVLESLKQMQNLMALTQALPAIDKGIKAMKKLQIALANAKGAASAFATALQPKVLIPITLAITGLIALFSKLNKRQSEYVEKQKQIIDQQKAEALKAQENYNKQLAKELEIKEKILGIRYNGDDIKVYASMLNYYKNELQGVNAALADPDNNKQRDELKRQWREQNKLVESLTEGSEEYMLALLELTSIEIKQREVKSLTSDEIDRLKTRQAELNDKVSEYTQNLKMATEIKAAQEAADLAKAYEELNKEIANYNKSQKDINIDKLNKEEEERIKIIKKAEKNQVVAEQKITAVKEEYAKKRAAIEQKEQLDSLKLMEDNYKLQQAALKASLDSQEIDLEYFNERKKELDDTYKDDYVKMLEDLLADETLNTQQRLQLYEKLNAFRNPQTEDTSTGTTSEEDPLTKQIADAINQSALALNDFSDNPAWSKVLQNISLIAANWDTMTEQIQGSWDEAFSAIAGIAATGLGAIAAMLNGLAAEQDATNKEGFESLKKLQVAGATMSMLAGIASAWASSMQLGPIAGPILGAILSAMMLGIGIAQIVKIKQQKFGGSGSGSAQAAPSLSAVTSITPPVQYTQDVQGANIEGAIKDTRVYVTEADISNTQKRVNVAESENRY